MENTTTKSAFTLLTEAFGADVQLEALLAERRASLIFQSKAPTGWQVCLREWDGPAQYSVSYFFGNEEVMSLENPEDCLGEIVDRMRRAFEGRVSISG